MRWATGKLARAFLDSFRGSGYASQVVTHERMLMKIPENLTFEEAAAIPEVFFTAYDALLDKADFQSGDTVLIHAGGSGVGTAATQLARLMGTSQILTTSRREWKLQKSLEMGKNRAIDTTKEDFDKVV